MEDKVIKFRSPETKQIYFDVIASDGGFNSTEIIALHVNDLNESVGNNVNQINTTNCLSQHLNIHLI